MKWCAKTMSMAENIQMAFIDTFFTSTYIYHTKLVSMPKLISQSCGELLQLATVCDYLSKGDGAIKRPPEHFWTSYSVGKEA